MYTYLRDIVPISSWCLSFLKSWSVGSKLRWLFRSCLLESHLVILTSRKDLMSSYFFVLYPLISRVVNFARYFLRKGIMEPALPCIFLLPPSLIVPSSVQIRFRDEATWRKVWPGVVFMQKFWNFKAIPDTEIILKLIQSKLFLKKFKWFLWRGFQKWWKLFVLLLVKNMRWHLVGQKSLRFNLRVTENRSSKHSFYLHE